MAQPSNIAKSGITVSSIIKLYNHEFGRVELLRRLKRSGVLDKYGKPNTAVNSHYFQMERRVVHSGEAYVAETGFSFVLTEAGLAAVEKFLDRKAKQRERRKGIIK